MKIDVKATNTKDVIKQTYAKFSNQYKLNRKTMKRRDIIDDNKHKETEIWKSIHNLLFLR